MTKTKKILLVSPPALFLKGSDGYRYSDGIPVAGVIMLQPLIGSLETAGLEVALFNMRNDISELSLGVVQWNNKTLTKTLRGMPVSHIPLDKADVFGITSNFHQAQEAVCHVVAFLASRGKKVVVGGSDAIAQPQVYVDAGATVVVLDKSGGSNAAAVEWALIGSTNKPCRLLTTKGAVEIGKWRLHPNDWTIPSQKYIKDMCEGPWRNSLPKNRFPLSSIVLDQGCDQDCNFCMTRRGGPYGLGYQHMSVQTVKRWVQAQVEAGIRTINFMPDQFLGRVLWPGGCEDVLEIMTMLRESGVTWMWRNGLELSKMTVGISTRQYSRVKQQGVDFTPNRELIHALYGPECINAFIPLERPVDGTKQYSKLMEWNNVKEVCKVIVESGAPDLLFGVIIGLCEDSHETLSRLDDALYELREILTAINPLALISFNPTNIILFPGIPLTQEYMDLGYIPPKTDPALITKNTPITGTDYLSVEELSAWQHRLYQNHTDGDRWGNRGVTVFS